MTETSYRCWAEIDREALRHNAGVAREKAGPSVDLLAVVKANAYGHGLEPVAEALAEEVDLFGVANLEEAARIRSAIAQPVMIMGPALPSEVAPIASAGFIPSISTAEEAEAFAKYGTPRRPVEVNFKIDTGMGRMGAPEKNAVELFRKVSAFSGLKVHSVSTHLPVSDEDESFTRTQLRTFGDLLKQLRTEVPGDYKAHALQTLGTLAFSEEPFEIVRPGILFYGISPRAEFQSLLRPAMTWKTRIALIRQMPEGHGISYGRTFITPKPMRVATLSAGYADGYPRHLSNRGASVLVRGKRCPLLGRVTMDLMVVNVTDLPEASVGDEVVLMGRQGEAEIACAELAERAGTITWEITTRVGSRVKLVYR